MYILYIGCFNICVHMLAIETEQTGEWPASSTEIRVPALRALTPRALTRLTPMICFGTRSARMS